ncbi:MAG: DUF3034 family protein [Pseudomonadota bacterium]|nr:DUF3034 family protein [Pseudomonadota bacterium]
MRPRTLSRPLCLRWTLGVLSCTASLLACAGDRLTATGGISDVDGAGGGGLTPWALITGYGTDGQVGGNAHITHLEISDFRLDSSGVAIGIDDRLELSLSRVILGLGSTVPGESIREDVAGIKLRLAGDAVFEPDRALPQVAIGAEYKHNLDAAPIPRALGARRDADFDYYLSATKLWFAAVGGRNLLANLTLRATRANQMGLLGFGGDRSDTRRLEPEGSLALFLRDDLAVGAEFRRKPDNLSAFHEDTFYDTFVAWFPLKSVSLTAAWTHLGRIADKTDQRGVLLQLQIDH